LAGGVVVVVVLTGTSTSTGRGGTSTGGSVVAGTVPAAPVPAGAAVVWDGLLKRYPGDPQLQGLKDQVERLRAGHGSTAGPS